MSSNAYTAGHFVFNLDDEKTESTSWLKSVDGGVVKGSVVTEHVGPDDLSFRHLSTVEVEPISVEVALSAAKPVLKWIQDSWSRKFSRRNGSVVHGDFKYRATLEQSFEDALISEISFPALDAGDKNPAYLSLKVHPERLALKKGDGKPIQGVEGANKGKLWSPSMFRLEIDGIDCSRVNKVDAITVKQKITQMYTGTGREPELEPTGIEFPTINVSMAAAFAQDFIDWHNQFVVSGDKELEQEKTGAIVYLDPSGDKTLFSIKLNGVAINSLAIEKSEANSESLKRVKAELYVDTMDLEFGEGFE